MNLFVHYFFSFLQKIDEFRYDRTQCKQFVLMFHEIPEKITNNNDNSISLDYKKFQELIIKLKSMGYGFKPIKSVIETEAKKTIYITFDDIFSSAYVNAIPYLESQHIPYTCFICPGLLNKEKYITFEQLKELSENNYSIIGAHSYTHRMLRDMNRNEILKEFCDSKYDLEQFIDRPIDIMAYPYGSRSACPLKVGDIAKEAGYYMAFSTYRLPVTKDIIDNNRFFIPRININESNMEKIIEYMEKKSNG